MVIPTTWFSAAAQNVDPSRHRYLDRCTHCTPLFHVESEGISGEKLAEAAGHGYTVMTMWSGDLGHSKRVSEDYILKMADRYFTAQTIVIGHLNHAPVTHVYGQLST